MDIRVTLKFWKHWISGLAITLASGAAAVFWFWSATVEIPSNIDQIIPALQWASTLNAWAALSAGVAATLSAVRFWREWIA